LNSFYYNFKNNILESEITNFCYELQKIYFTSNEIRTQAIKKYGDDYIKYCVKI